MSVDNVVSVEHAFGAHDMFTQTETREEEMGTLLVTVRLFAEADKTFDDVSNVEIADGFLKIEQNGELFAFNVQDVAAYRIRVA